MPKNIDMKGMKAKQMHLNCNICYNRFSLMCEVGRGVDGQNALLYGGRSYQVGIDGVHQILD